MKRRKNILLMILSGLLAVSLSCQPKTEYQKLVETELAQNVRQDSLFLGIHFNMNRKDFFAHCWDLNKQGILTNGTGNSVLYDVSQEFKEPTNMNFYPKFVDGKIFEMPVEFQYEAWAPWNKDLGADILLEEVKATLDRWYGEGYLKMVSPDGLQTVWVKVNGNRRIRVFRKSVSSVSVIFTDLIQLEEMKEANT